MKLSIWQQFSSNHSAAFSIVAKFESAEKALAVAAQVTEMLLDVYRWKDYDLGEWDRNPSQIIQEFEHKVAFGTSWMLSESHIKRALQVNSNEIFVSDAPGYSNFDGSDLAFIALFERFEAEVIALRENAGGDVFINLSGGAADEKSAELIIGSIIQRKTYRGETEYIHDKLDKGYHNPARTVRREGQRIFLEDIFAWPHLEALSYWYSFAKAHALSDIRLGFWAERSMERLEVNLDDAKFRQIMWHDTKFRHWADNVNLPSFAIGEFESQTAADIAAQKIRAMLLKIQEWSKANPEESKWVWEAFWERLSPIEMALKTEYGIEWSMSAIEWIHHCKQAADFIVVQIDKQVFLANTENNWIGVSPFQQILAKLGARKLEGLLLFDIEISVPNSMNLQGLWWMIEGAVRAKDYVWLPFYRDYKNPKQWRDHIDYIRLQNKAAKEYVDSLQQFIDMYSNLKIEYQLTEFLQKVYTMPDLFDADTLRLKAIIRDCELSYKAISSKDNVMTLEKVAFPSAPNLLGLEAFIRWLKSMQCEVRLSIAKLE